MPNYLKVIFFAQLFERFSYYGIRSVLLLFFIQSYGYSDNKAYFVLSLFAAFAYALPVISSFLSDRVFGFYSVMITGAIFCCLAQFFILLSFFYPFCFFIGLGLLITGTGYFKTNMTNLLGEFYNSDVESSKAFTLLHVGVNIGAGLAPIFAGYIGYYYGWHSAFAFSSMGIFISTAILLFNKKLIHNKGLSPNPELLKKRYFKLSLNHIFLIASLFVSGICAYCLMQESFNYNLFYALGLGCLIFLIYSAIKNKVKMNALIIFLLILISSIFFAFTWQFESLILLFADRNVASKILGITIPAAISQAINPVSVIFFGLLISYSKKLVKFPLFNFFVGLFISSFSFLILYYASFFAVDFKISYLYFSMSIMLIGIAELCVIPFVQSQITSLSPKNMKSFMMSLFMLAMSFSSILGMYINKMMSIDDSVKVDLAKSLVIYANGFKNLAYYNIFVMILFSLIFFIIYKFSRKK